MGSIPVGTNKFTGTYQKPESSYSVMVSTADFESVNLGSNPSKSLTMVEQKECFQTAIQKIQNFVFENNGNSISPISSRWLG